MAIRHPVLRTFRLQQTLDERIIRSLAGRQISEIPSPTAGRIRRRRRRIALLVEISGVLRIEKALLVHQLLDALDPLIGPAGALEAHQPLVALVRQLPDLGIVLSRGLLLGGLLL